MKPFLTFSWWHEEECVSWNVLVGLKWVCTPATDSLRPSLSRLQTLMSRDVVSVSKNSAVHLISNWKMVICLINELGQFLSVNVPERESVSNISFLSQCGTTNLIARWFCFFFVIFPLPNINENVQNCGLYGAGSKMMAIQTGWEGRWYWKCVVLRERKNFQSSFCRLHKALHKNAIFQSSLDYRVGFLHCTIRWMDCNGLLFHYRYGIINIFIGNNTFFAPNE